MSLPTDNPLVELVLSFQDGCQLGLRMDYSVPQVKAMSALGHFAAEVGTELNITLPRQPKELVAEAIKVFIASEGGLLAEDLVREGELSSDNLQGLATAILEAVVMPEMEEACMLLFSACAAQHTGLDLLFARLAALDKKFRPSESGQPWEAIQQGNTAVATARQILVRFHRQVEGGAT